MIMKRGKCQTTRTTVGASCYTFRVKELTYVHWFAATYHTRSHNLLDGKRTKESQKENPVIDGGYRQHIRPFRRGLHFALAF